MSSAAMADKISHQQWFFRWVRDAAADVEQGQSNCTARYKAKQRHYRRANIGNKLGKLLSLLYGLLRFLKNLSFLGFFLRWLCLFRSFFACFRSLFCFCYCRLFCFCRLLCFHFFCFCCLFRFCLRSLFCFCRCFCRCRLFGLRSLCGFCFFFFGGFRCLFGYRLGFCLCFQSFYLFFLGNCLGFCLRFLGSFLCLHFCVCCN